MELTTPLYVEKSFKRVERTLAKFEAKNGWYSCENAGRSRWRSNLPTEWKGSKPLQTRVPGIPFTSVLQVQSSRDSRLLKAIAKIEPSKFYQ